MPATPRILLLLLLALGLAACGGSRSAGPTSGEETATVRVVNQAWLQVNVYVVASGQRVRLGTVSGNSTDTFRLPRGVIGFGREVSFQADPVGSSSVARSFEQYVRPGEEVTITIPPTVR